jgi:FAD/FMN-containing dehydrogenase/Fe-S oxidoreductase
MVGKNRSGIVPPRRPAGTLFPAMNPRAIPLDSGPTATARSPLAARLRREVEGEILFDAASCGRYSTDASIYQIMPIGVVVPHNPEAALIALQIAAQEGVAILPRGAGTSQCGQTVGAALVIDHSKYLNRLVEFDAEAMRAVVEPGMVLDHLNARLRQYGLWFPVDVSTSAQATIGGMTGNNSCGSRSIAYGNMVHRVSGIRAWLSNNERAFFGPVPADLAACPAPGIASDLARKTRGLWEREKDEIAVRFPKVMRRVAGYNLDCLSPDAHHLAKLLVGSEGTLAYFEQIHLDLARLPMHKVLGVCHFPRFYDAMNSAQHIVKLGPCAVELVDRTMLDLSRQIAAFKSTVDAFLNGAPDCVLLVEFAGDDETEQAGKLKRLIELMGDLGFPDSVVEVRDAKLQKAVWEVRKAGLNIMMSMKGDGKPVSFIEDCAVPLEHLAEYTSRLTEIFRKHGTEGTWYAHASVGCLHVRPILNMRADGAHKMRVIAEQAAQLVHEYKGAYSGEHGDGLVRSEWIAPFFGPRLTAALGEIKAWFDPKGLMNPGKIVNPSRQDDRSLFRFKPGYAVQKMTTVLDWNDAGGFDKAVEMCNNNGHCRKFDTGTMCPSYRASGDEKHVTRGRANTLRLAISGQLGPDAFTSGEMYDTLDLCVSCKGCKRECPTGVDMAKMKIEFLHHYKRTHGFSLQDRLIANLPRYAPWAAKLPWFFNLRDAMPGFAWLSERLFGLSSQRKLPKWRGDPWHADFFGHAEGAAGERTNANAPEVVLLVDTFNNYFEPDNARAAMNVLSSAGYRVHIPRAAKDERPLCCGRTFLATGMVDEAKREVRRTLDALKPYVERGMAVVGLEPSCLFTLRDEFKSLFPGAQSDLLAAKSVLFEEFLVAEKRAGRLNLKLQALSQRHALVHGHCHQKAFDAFGAAQEVLGWIPELSVEPIESSCCGMAGAFGYQAKHYAMSMKMAEASLLPAVRNAPDDTLIVADGTSCRTQIHDGAGRYATHVARILEQALAP